LGKGSKLGLAMTCSMRIQLLCRLVKIYGLEERMTTSRVGVGAELRMVDKGGFRWNCFRARNPKQLS